MEHASRPRNSSVPSYRPIQSERALAHDQSQLVPGSGEGQPTWSRGGTQRVELCRGGAGVESSRVDTEPNAQMRAHAVVAAHG